MAVSVLDGHRKPVRGLTAADFTLLEDGTPRTIEAFAEIHLPAPVPGAEPIWSHLVTPDVATNRIAEDEGRLVVILMDRSIPVGQPEMAATRIALRTIDDLGPNDEAAVLSTNGGVGQGFTSDRARLKQAISRGGWASGVSSETQEAEENLSSTGSASPFTSLTDGRCMCGECEPLAIKHVADALQTAPRRRKILLFIGANLTLQAAGDCNQILKDARNAMFQAVDRANLTIYSLDPSGLDVVVSTGRAGSPRRAGRSFDAFASSTMASLQNQMSLHVLPDRTGGRAISNTNEPEDLVPDIFEESSSYYILGFRPGDGANDGRFHPIKVSVDRRGARVHTRTGYMAPTAAAAGSPSPGAPQPPASGSVGDALTGAVPDAAVHMDLNAAVFAASDDKVGLMSLAVGVTGFAPKAPETNASTVSPLEVVATAYDHNGQPRASSRETLQLSWPSSFSAAPHRVERALAPRAAGRRL